MTDAPLGLLGGTFDPVHIGHLRLAIEARERLGLASVHLVPACHPPHREPPVASAAERLRMVRLAIGGERGLVADGRELERGGLSYTVDTLRALRAAEPARPLVWLIGADALAGLAGWREWRAIPDLAHLAVFERPGAPAPSGEVARLVAEREAPVSALGAAPAGALVRIDAPRLDVSASALRAGLAEGRSARYLVPDAVLTHIHERRLYGAG